MTRWELTRAYNWFEAQALATDGWELVSVTYDGIGTTFWFKRPLPDAG